MGDKQTAVFTIVTQCAEGENWTDLFIELVSELVSITD
jgi:hypothetical protein